MDFELNNIANTRVTQPESPTDLLPSTPLLEAHHQTSDSQDIALTNILLFDACQDPNISETDFRHIYNNSLRLDCDLTNPEWYYWEPIHYAAYHMSVVKLTVIKDLDEHKLNSLTVMSENALHVLLEYGRRINSFNVQLSNGWESRVCQVIAQEKQQVVDCAELLVNAGIDINHNNLWNETPLIIAIRYRLLKVVELLLNQPQIDLDTCKDPISKKSARDLLRENELFLNILTPNTVAPEPTKALFTFLKNRDEELFLRHNNENITQYANALDGDDPRNTSGTMLQLCLIKGYVDYEKECETSNETDILKTAILKHFCQKGFGRSIEHLLKNGANILARNRMFIHRNVFEMSVKLGYYPFLAIILEHKSSQIQSSHITDVLKSIDAKAFEQDNWNVRHGLWLLTTKLELIYLDKKPAYDGASRRELDGVLQLYVEHDSGDIYKENILQLLRLGASLLRGKNDGLKSISHDTLRAHLDECVWHENSICYDSLIVDNEEEYTETEALHYFRRDPKKIDLLSHPALIYLIHTKWLKCKSFFYLNLVLYLCFLVTLHVYMFYLQANRQYVGLTSLFILLLVVLVLKELFQIILYFPQYLHESTNTVEWIVLICCIINVFFKYEMAMIIAILFSTLAFLLMLGQSPKFTKYMIIFSSSKYFLQYVMFYLMQFVSFALCFLILLPPPKDTQNDGPLGHLLIKLFDTLIFFIGQYDGDITHPPNFPIFGRIVVASFVFCMTIILNNLLVGLIVTDMDKIQKTSKEQRQAKMIRYISRIEKFLNSHALFQRFFENIFGSMKVFEQGQYKVLRDVRRTSSVFDDDDKAYLKEIHENRVQEKNVLKNVYEYIIDEIYNEQRGMRDNRDIMLKLARLEEHFRRNRLR